MDELSVVGICVFAATALAALIFYRGAEKAIDGYSRSVARVFGTGLQKQLPMIHLRWLSITCSAAAIAIPISIWLFLDLVIPAILMAMLLFFSPKIILRWMQSQRRDKLMQQLPDALMMLAGALRAGSALGNALASMSTEIGPPISQEFALLLREQRLGVTLDDALVNMERRVAAPDFALVLSAIRIAREVGGNLAETLERLAHTLRQKASMEGKIRSLTAQGKLQGIVVGLLPLALAMVLFFMDPTAMSPLVTLPIGWMVCAVIAILEFLGAFTIWKIIMIDV